MRKNKLPKMAGAEGRAPKGYPVEQIRDFIQHLLWEARIAHFEATNPGTVNPELVDELAVYSRKYGCVLWPSRQIDPEDLTPAEVARTVSIQRTREAAAAQAAVTALEEALPFIERALEIQASRSVPVYHLSAREILRSEEG